MKAEYTDVRQHIIDQGKAIITRKGFAGVGLNEILSAADVPKGSFYHYFKSKELFGEAMLEDYVTGYLAGMEDMLGQPGQSAAQSLMAYWASWTSESFDGSGCDCRCLVVSSAAKWRTCPNRCAWRCSICSPNRSYLSTMRKQRLMNAILLLIAFGAGIAIALQTTLNGQLARGIGGDSPDGVAGVLQHWRAVSDRDRLAARRHRGITGGSSCTAALEPFWVACWVLEPCCAMSCWHHVSA